MDSAVWQYQIVYSIDFPSTKIRHTIVCLQGYKYKIVCLCLFIILNKQILDSFSADANNK